MKNIFKICTVVLSIALIAMGFKINQVKNYGGTASVTITTYKVKFDGYKYVPADKITSAVLEAEARCRYANETEAKSALKTDLDGLKLTKNEYGKVIAEFTSSISYSISSCEK